MPNRPCLEAIDERALVRDGAMGTQLHAKHGTIARKPVAAVRPLASGVPLGTAGHDSPSLMSVPEAIA